MANKTQELRARHDAAAREVKNLCDQNPGSSWSTEHQAVYDATMTEIEVVRAEIRREEAVSALNYEKAAEKAGITFDDAPKSRSPLLAKWLRSGGASFSAQDWQSVRNVTSTTTGAEGGFTVETSVAEELLKAMKEYGGMRHCATTFSTAQGNPMNWPTMDDTANVGELVPENASAVVLDPAFGTVSLNVFKFSSKVVAIPIELLQDSQVDIESTVVALLAERLARIQNTLFTTGTGTAQPRGIVTAAGLGVALGVGNVATFSYDNIVALEHSVDPAYRNLPHVGFMMSDAALRIVRQLKDAQGRPIFVPGYEVGVPGGAPSTLLGRPLWINQDIAVPAASARSILFGALGNYRIRDALSPTLFRFTDSVYASRGQVGFLAWQRSGGNLLDISGTSVRYLQQSAT